VAGRFITIEGGEGAGKTTQARRLADALRQSGLTVLRTREPGGAPGAELLRGLLLGGGTDWSPLAEALLHYAARAEHVAKTIRPALDAGTWVVCDRFADSTMAYQGYGQGADRAALDALAGLVGLVPDLTIMLEVPLATSLARLRARGAAADRYERLGEAFFIRVNHGFAAIAAAEPGRCAVVPATAPEASVAAQVLAAVRDRLGAP